MVPGNPSNYPQAIKHPDLEACHRQDCWHRLLPRLLNRLRLRRPLQTRPQRLHIGLHRPHKQKRKLRQMMDMHKQKGKQMRQMKMDMHKQKGKLRQMIMDMHNQKNSKQLQMMDMLHKQKSKLVRTMS